MNSSQMFCITFDVFHNPIKPKYLLLNKLQGATECEVILLKAGKNITWSKVALVYVVFIL